MSDPVTPSRETTPPAFQFYASDFLSSTSEMTAEEAGAYIRLLCHQWIRGGIPDDDSRLAAMAGVCGGNAVAYAKSRFRLCDDGLLRHPRLEQTREKLDAYRSQQSQNSQKRWRQSHRNPTALPPHIPPHIPNASSPSPSPSSIGKGAPPFKLKTADRISIEKKLEILNSRLQVLKEDTSEQWQLAQHPEFIVEKKKVREQIKTLENQLLEP